jgi:hypothetical protein
MNDLHHDTYTTLAGPAALETNTRILNGMAQYLNDISTFQKSLKLFDWIKTAYTVVTADTFFGKVNPIAENPDLVKLLW